MRLVAFCAGALAAFPLAAASQQGPAAEPGPGAGLPAAVAERVADRLNAPSTRLEKGGLNVPAGVRLVGDLAVLDGNLSMGGIVQGEVLVVNGSVDFLPGSAIDGDLLVVGGGITGQERATISGEMLSYDDRFVYERVAGAIRPSATGQGGTDPGGSSDFLITTGKSYNRVEGLPIAFGPRMETAGSNPFRLQALGIYRTESGLSLDPEEMGYFVRADQYVGGRLAHRFGATLYSAVDPIEEWQLSDLESGLATFFLHRDYRDHYQRQGGSVFATWEPGGGASLLHLEARWEKHGSRAASSPWSLFRNAEEWRPQPVVAEGSLGSVLVQGVYDTRAAQWNPATGWLARAQLEQAFRADLVHPLMASLEATEPTELASPARYGRFLTGLLDVRRYNRINPDSRLNLRFVAGGSLTGKPLPPQRQHALGGEGSLPGYGLFSSDCEARKERVVLPAHRTPEASVFFPHYGCDAFALLQAEFRGKLSFRFRWDVGPWREERPQGERPWDFGWDMSPDWSIFVDAGRGWTFHERPNERTRVDVGGGVLLERVGLYLAVPVTGGTGANLFVRLGPRF